MTRPDLERLARIPLQTEDDVREEFVTPLLRLLGFDHERGEIRRAPQLTTSYQSGTKRKEYVKPDYLVGSSEHTYLALDAKSPASDTAASQDVVTDTAYVGQVHSYAAHREVNAALFVIVNGTHIAVYRTNSPSYEPLALVAQDELLARFDELSSLISKVALAREYQRHLPPAWVFEVARREAGFQPMNLAVGDFNHDGAPEVAIAISEDRIPVVSAAGYEVEEYETSGWTWWVTATGSNCGGRSDPRRTSAQGRTARHHRQGGRSRSDRALGTSP